MHDQCIEFDGLINKKGYGVLWDSASKRLLGALRGACRLGESEKGAPNA
jgi:hypothetical protein